MKSRIELGGGGQPHLDVSPACAVRAVGEVNFLSVQ